LANDFQHRDTSMMEDCATRMFVPHGCNDDTAVVESFKEALKQRVGADRFQMWFTHGVDFTVGNRPDTDPNESVVLVRVRGQFALDRIQNHWIRELRGAAMQALGAADVELCLDQPVARQSVHVSILSLTDGGPKVAFQQRSYHSADSPAAFDFNT
jgi:hypothetical protein